MADFPYHVPRPVVTAQEVVDDLLSRARVLAENLPRGYLLEIVVNGHAMSVEVIQPCGRGLIEIHGKDVDGRPCLLVQHVSQANMVFRSAKEDDKRKRPQPAGF